MTEPRPPETHGPARGAAHRPSSWRAAAVTALALLCALAWIGCGETTEGTATAPDAGAEPAAQAAGATGDAGIPAPRGDGRRRVFLIGIDGASPKVVVPLMRKGRLPNLARIARQGVYGPIRSEHPLYSPRIWNSIATGKDPDDHGITAFVHKDENDENHLYVSSDRRVPAIWNIASAAGRSVGIVNWWTTWPPEVIEGVMVSDHFFPQQSALIRNTFQDEREITGARVYPESWTDEAEAARLDDTQLVTVRDPFADPEPLSDWINTPLLSDYYRNDLEITRVALAAEAAFSPDLSIVFLPGIDRMSHWMWGNLEPGEKYPEELRPTKAERRAGAAALFAYYEYTDQLIGRLLRAADGDDLVIVLSDHGFEAQVSMMLLTGGHETGESIDGVLYARGPGVPRGAGPGPVSVLDVTPTVLAWMGIAPAEDMKGRPMPFVEIEVPDMVASHDGLEIERLEIAASGAEDEIVEHLRALGYLEGDGVDENPSAGSPEESGTNQGDPATD